MVIEAYVLASLLGLGYYLHVTDDNNSRVQGTASRSKAAVPASDRPSMKDLYSSSHTQTVARHERACGAQAAKQASEQTFRSATAYSPLLGTEVPVADFRHNNMVPFYGAHVKQNVEGNANQALLETYVGSSASAMSHRTRKSEVGPLFAPSRNLAFVNGQPVPDRAGVTERMQSLRLRNNETPFDQVRVGPGIAAGFTSLPSGGFGQALGQDFARPKTVDELRVASKPKETFASAPFAPGQAIPQRAMRPHLANPATDRVFPVEPGGALGRAAPMVVSDAARLPLSQRGEDQGVMAGPHQPRRGGESGPCNTRVPPERAQMSQSGDVGPLGAAGRWSADVFDYGLSGAASRQGLSQRGGTPLEASGFLRASSSRTLDPLEEPRLSRKELTVHFDELRNMHAGMPDKPTLYDPNQVTRTTIKETLLHDEFTGGVVAPDAPRVGARDPDGLQARYTGRQTMNPVLNDTNLATGRVALTVHDPDAPPRNTMRQTTQDQAWTGPLGTLQETNAGYTVAQPCADPTLRQLTSDCPSQPGPAWQANVSGAYAVATCVATPRDTQKQGLNNTEHFGAAGNTGAKAPASYLEIYNATISQVKEQTLQRPGPVPEGAKVTAGAAGLGKVDKTTLRACMTETRPRPSVSVLVTNRTAEPGDATRCRLVGSEAPFRVNPVAARPTDPGPVIFAPPRCNDPEISRVCQQLASGELPRFFPPPHPVVQ
jgi:hypothetical protein